MRFLIIHSVEIIESLQLQMENEINWNFEIMDYFIIK